MSTTLHLTFQSTLPAGEATTARPPKWCPIKISIHASRGGSDERTAGYPCQEWNFNPRFPRGKRLVPVVDEGDVIIISIHASRGGSDPRQRRLRHVYTISIHASRGGSDKSALCRPDGRQYFNPRFPRGKRPAKADRTAIIPNISIHASRGGSDGTGIIRW